MIITIWQLVGILAVAGVVGGAFGLWLFYMIDRSAGPFR